VEFRVIECLYVRRCVFLDPPNRRGFASAIGLNHVPVLAATASMYDTLGITDMPALLNYADGKSVMGDITGPLREGVVFKQVDGGMTFKVISNKYLLNEK